MKGKHKYVSTLPSNRSHNLEDLLSIQRWSAGKLQLQVSYRLLPRGDIIRHVRKWDGGNEAEIIKPEQTEIH